VLNKFGSQVVAFEMCFGGKRGWQTAGVGSQKGKVQAAFEDSFVYHQKWQSLEGEFE